jgi:hypothetical protein
VLYLDEHVPGVIQPAKQRTCTAPRRRWSDLLLARNCTRTLGKSVYTKYLAPDWSYKMSSASAVILRSCPGEEALEDVFFSFGGSSSGHVAKVKDAA